MATGHGWAQNEVVSCQFGPRGWFRKKAWHTGLNQWEQGGGYGFDHTSFWLWHPMRLRLRATGEAAATFHLTSSSTRLIHPGSVVRSPNRPLHLSRGLHWPYLGSEIIMLTPASNFQIWSSKPCISVANFHQGTIRVQVHITWYYSWEYKIFTLIKIWDGDGSFTLTEITPWVAKKLVTIHISFRTCVHETTSLVRLWLFL